VGQRLKDAAEASVAAAFDRGDILRTHALRPTWHFLAPADIRWIQELTAPRVRAFLAYHDRKLELAAPELRRSRAALVKALTGKNALTRGELQAGLHRAKITASGQRLAQVVMHAELDALLCSGPLRGKQHTYMLLDERAPPAGKLSRDEALAQLTLRYFTSHGPATLRDFQWWSSLSAVDAKAGLESVRNSFEKMEVEGKLHWHAPGGPRQSARPLTAYFLSEFDETLIAYRDCKIHLSDRAAKSRSPLGMLERPIVIDGEVVGTWSRKVGKARVDVAGALFVRPTARETEALHAGAERYGRFLGLEAALHFRTPK
jgi:hypothetical protein